MIQKRPQHPPGIIPHFIFYQHQVWVDKYGVEHEIESMEREYVEKVVAMLRRIAPSLYSKEMLYRALDLLERIVLEGRDELQSAIDDFKDEFINPPYEKMEKIDRSILSETDNEILQNSYAWLENTQLMRALNRRVER